MDELKAISVKEVSFSYNSVPVLEYVTFNINRYEFLTMVGPNGGGKTTLLKIILGLLKPDSGTVRIFGKSPERSREKFGYMPQYTLFDPQFPVTVMDVVLMGCLDKHFGGAYSKTDKQSARDALDEVGMGSFGKGRFSTLSGGQRQRVLLARAIVSRPEILLLDEPLANVDMEIENRLYSILQELNKRMTILMVTHDLGFVSPIAKNCICVNKRVVIHPTSEINGKVIQEIYGRDIRMVRHDQISHREERTSG